VNEQLGKVAAESILRGASDVLDALLSLVLQVKVNTVEPCSPELLPLWLGTYPVSASIRTEAGHGVTLLIETESAANLLDRMAGKPAGEREALTDEDRESLTESLGIALTQGFSQFLSEAGEATPGDDAVTVRSGGDADAAAILNVIGESAGAAQVTLSSVPDFELDAMLLYSDSIEPLAAGTLAADAPPQPNVLSPEEMNDILSGFTPSPNDMGLGGSGVSSTPLPMNIDMVLDIRLRATARLGSIELPLGDVLSFGPGTIIDVGRLVDEPVDLLVNNKLIARGDVVVVDEKYGLRITEIVSPRERIESLR